MAAREDAMAARRRSRGASQLAVRAASGRRLTHFVGTLDPADEYRPAGKDEP